MPVLNRKKTERAADAHPLGSFAPACICEADANAEPCRAPHPTLTETWCGRGIGHEGNHVPDHGRVCREKESWK
jgi:hypothetical protein